ncbi:MAG: hydrolase [Oscillospiraceae bacterium]
MKKYTKALAFLLVCTLIFATLVSCKGRKTEGDATPPPAEATPTASAEPTPSPTPAAPVVTATPADYVPFEGPVEHIFFHPLMTYPALSFSNIQADGFDDWFVTVDEYEKMLASLYKNDYILVDITKVWSEGKNEAGETRMVRNPIMVPPGKKPLIISFDDVNYYDYMREAGTVYKLIVGENGEIWSWGIDPDGKEVISQDLDIITVLTKFVKAHPDFSLDGAMGCIGLTGYQGILGYRTQNDIDLAPTDPLRPAFDAARQAEIDGVKPVVERLKADGYTFASHSWGHIQFESRKLDTIKRDTDRWLSEVGSLIGPTPVLLYPYGSRPDGGKENGPCFAYLQEVGFRIFPAVGVEPYQKIRSDTSAVVCDRMHPDGTTLRHSRDRYLRFYDAKDVMNTAVRPDRGTNWSAG